MTDWYFDKERGVYWMQRGDEEMLARVEFVERNFEFAAAMLGTTADELRNAPIRAVPPARAVPTE